MDRTLNKEDTAMLRCGVCGCRDHRKESVDNVLHIDGEYVLVKGIPAWVCERCGEYTFSADDVETVSAMVHDESDTGEFIKMQVLRFASHPKSAPDNFVPAYSVHED